MALPLLGVMMGAQLLTSVVGAGMQLYQQHENNEMAEKFLKQQQQTNQMAMQQFGMAQGGGMPQGYPQLG